MKAYTYIDRGRFEMRDKPRPEIKDPRDAVVRVTLGSICTSDLHIKHGSVPRAVKGITVGHEMVGVVEAVGSAVTSVKKGDRVTVNVETFCGECFFCRHGYVNNCSDPDGGWALGCRIDGGQAEYVRVPHADQGLTRQGALRGRHPRHRILGRTHIGDIIGRYRRHHRRRPYGNMHSAVRDVEAAEAHYRMREVAPAGAVRA